MIPTKEEATSTAPDSCQNCGEMWSAGQLIQTGDAAAFEGWEDWRYRQNCGEELFFPMQQIINESAK